ncbi:MAG: hypothetical protein H0U97_02065 [Gammaproteobacteria bacterium]|nr:hypothetical protein [Gammaproteobacteria bacterium]
MLRAVLTVTWLLPTFTDYIYDFKSVYYPWALAGVSLPLAPPKLINCCTFAGLAGESLGQHARAWNSKRHGQMMIASANDLFSPVTAMIEAEMGTPVPANQPPSAWCLLQGWRSSTSGHTFMIVAYHAATDRVLTLEANAAYSIKGVGYRNLWQPPRLPRRAASVQVVGKFRRPNLAWDPQHLSPGSEDGEVERLRLELVRTAGLIATGLRDGHAEDHGSDMVHFVLDGNREKAPRAKGCVAASAVSPTRASRSVWSPPNTNISG